MNGPASAQQIARVWRLIAREPTLAPLKTATAAAVPLATVNQVVREDAKSAARRSLVPHGGEPQRLLERCPGCGGLVYMPCRLCRARRQIDEGLVDAERQP